MIKVIPQNHCRIIERFGRPARVQKSGINFHFPFIDKPKDVSILWGIETNGSDPIKQMGPDGGQFIELSEQIMDTDKRECITKDNAKIHVDAVINWRVVDPIKAVYEVDQLHDSIEQTSLNILRSEVGSRELDDVLQSRSSLNEAITSKLAQTTAKWGIQLLRVEIQELETDDKTSDAMLQQLDAERKSRALALEAEGAAKATLAKATADRDAAILRAEGAAKALEIAAKAEKAYLETLSKTVGADQANRILLAQKAIEGYNVISSNPADKVYVPNSAQVLISDNK